MDIKKIILEEVDDFSNFEWTKDSRDPEYWETNALYKLNSAFKDSEYNIELMSEHEAGIYKNGDHFSTLRIGDPVHVWVSEVRKDYRQVSGMFGDDNRVAIEYKNIHNTLVNYLNSWGMAGNGEMFKLIRESVDNDLSWIEDNDSYDGLKFKVLNNMTAMEPLPVIITLQDDGRDIVFVYNNDRLVGSLRRSDVDDFVERGEWYPVEPKLNESDDFSDFDWAEEVKPDFWRALDWITKDNDNINLVFDESGDFDKIRDNYGAVYFDTYHIGSMLDMEPDEVQNITKGELLMYLRNEIGSSWGFDDPSYEHDENYKDYMDLYGIIKKI